MNNSGRGMSSSTRNLVVTDEVIINDDDILVDLSLSCTTNVLYDTLVRLSNIVSKNAKASNHVEDVVSNLKLFVETNIGKLSRLSSAMEENNKNLTLQMAKLVDDMKTVKEQCLRKDEYEVDIRRVKNQLQPCSDFVEDVVDSKRSYALDLYIRDILQTDMEPNFLRPLKSDISNIINSSIDASNRYMGTIVSQHSAQHTASIHKLDERVNQELCSIQGIMRKATEDSAVTHQSMDTTALSIAAINHRVDSGLTTMKEALEAQTKKLNAQVASLDDRHKKVVELLGFRETGGVVQHQQGTSFAQMHHRQSVVAGSPPQFMMAAPEQAYAPSPSTPNPASPPPTPTPVQRTAATTLFVPSSTDVPSGAPLQADVLMSSITAANSVAIESPFSADGPEGSPFSPPATQQTGGGGVSAFAAGMNDYNNNQVEVSLPSRPSSTASSSAVAPSPQSVRLLARGKSILQTNNPVQGTGLFSTQVFQQFNTHVKQHASELAESTESKFADLLRTAVTRLEALIDAKQDKEEAEEDVNGLFGVGRGGGSQHVREQLSNLTASIEGLRMQFVSEIGQITALLQTKSDESVVAHKVNVTDFEAANHDLGRQLSEIMAFAQQATHLVRKLEADMKGINDSLADQGILMPTYNSGRDMDVSGLHYPNASRLTGSAQDGGRAGGGFPMPATGLPVANKKAAIPGVGGGKPLKDVVHAHLTLSKMANRMGVHSGSSTSGRNSEHIMSAHLSPTSTLPSLHEVVFDMTPTTFQEHKKRSEQDKRPVVAPRPPSNPTSARSDRK